MDNYTRDRVRRYYDEQSDPFYVSPRRQRYLGMLHRHPDCNDPDHPGCEKCEPRNEEPEEVEK